MSLSKTITRGLVALFAAGALAGAAAPANADSGRPDGAWITVSPSVVRCTTESQVRTVELSWWTPARSIYPGFEDSSVKMFANGVYVDGVSYDVGRLMAGEEHSVSVPFRCNRESHTYKVTNPSGYGNLTVTATRQLRKVGDLLKDNPLTRPSKRVDPSSIGDRVRTTPDKIPPCALRDCVPEVTQPQPKSIPTPKKGPVTSLDSARIITRG